MHYGFGLVAPYPLMSLPKLFGVRGEYSLRSGPPNICLKTKANPTVEASSRRAAIMALLLSVVRVNIWVVALLAGGTTLAGMLLILHLASIACLFVSIPFSKMVHGFFP